jgi:hypothetical protein
MRKPIVAMDVTALKATREPSAGRDKQKDRRADNQTALTGHIYTSLTLLK